ncbi:Rtr1/RPAP2 family-domain-containing protein [Ampelomyces quisqualis]|uniref:RNA polymerase II subunit B1 CTD phosphatase RPAP2 homolog n=1 Tax=Ampelomyces quisqualis TaxID=50730 RepID=A0A6A5QEY1_AMPQU|nr:Rtr1/RPAP2 family-domain-containing protein [Ampelomyces quisqualis]
MPPNQRHLHTALHHANVLAERKRVEAAVLAAVLMLLDYPTAPGADARRPTRADAQHFCAAVRPFQPADYDALIEERSLAGKCGYALCPRPAQKARSTARRQFVDTAHGVQIVDRHTLEVWCSRDCAERALYVKVQLHEDPAWMRQGGRCGDPLELLVDGALPLQTAPAPLPVPADQDALDAEAVEGLVRGHITERMPSATPPQPPSLPAQPAGQTMAIEGHVPRMDRSGTHDDGDEDDDPQDWDKHLPGWDDAA